jgi:hypothetical protein
MKRLVVRYKAKPDRADENDQAIRKVFEELHAKAPEGLHYAVLRLEDGTFIHFVTLDDEGAPNPMSGIAAFQAFQKGVGERAIEQPQASPATLVGNYRLLGET